MRRPVGLLLLVLLPGIALTACGDTEAPEEESFCTISGCLPSVALNLAALGEVASSEVCLDDECQQLEAPGPVISLGPEDADGPDRLEVTGSLVLADGSDLQIGPTVLVLQEVFPNGEGCDPTCWGAEATVAADGSITQVAPSDPPATSEPYLG